VSGALTLLNRVPTHGRAPCYLEISANGRFVLVNNYLDGTAASFPIQPDGRLGKAISIVRENGSGPNKARQNASHVHSITLDPNNHLAITANLGTDRLTVYRFDSNSGKLTPLSGKITHTAPGAGPRHLVFTTDGTCAYVANELNNSVEAFHFNVLTGTLKHFQTIPTVPEDFSGTNYPADIHISPDGKFLYVSNRGAENLAIFSVAPKTGRLAFLATQSVRGSWPRNFALSHDGHLLVVANQKSKTLVVFRRNPYSGFLQWLSTTPTEAFPACVKIADF
jgi:6-phosphogluconolactonase